ncbi:MAG: hypothetical protein MN733_24015, partial [Nitrososphaera sp.]|nr:hypothetical protein [Nitrososphaera sp.]
MVNNRTFYAVKQLSVKNTSYANNGVLLDAIQVVVSGTHASGATVIPLDNGSANEAIPAFGQFITPSGEVISYTAYSGSQLTGGGLSGVTRGYVNTLPNTVTSGTTLKYHGWEVSHGVQSVG